MRGIFCWLLCVLVCVQVTRAVSKPHVITLGKWTTVKCFAGPEEKETEDIKIRPLLVDGQNREFVSEAAHEITERLFVVRRGYRLNDVLPVEVPSAPRWQWQRGGWLLVDRMTGRISPVNLAEFDPYISVATWYRDYVAYCGVSEDGKKLLDIVAQLGLRRSILKESLGDTADEKDFVCTPPTWQRQPTRVTFERKQREKVTYAIRNHAADVVTAPEEPDETD